jgi:hypothetical protein
MHHELESPATTNLRHALRTSARISRLMDPPLPPPSTFTAGAVPMAEPTSSAIAGGILAKLAPAGVGALIMVLVDPPANKRELFFRVFVAFAASYLLGDVVFDMLHSTAAFAFLDHSKRAHTVAIDGLVGALGWSFFAGVLAWLRRFRTDPQAAVKEVKP